MLKKLHGASIYVQSAGVRTDRDIDGFAISVCEEIGVPLSRHRTRSFDDMEEWGDQISGYELIIAMTPAAQRKALEYTRYFALDVEYWPVMDPTGFGDDREARLTLFRSVRDEIVGRITERFGVGRPFD